MRFLYIGYYTNELIFNDILNKKINNMSPARQKFEYNLIKGLFIECGTDIQFYSYVPTDRYLKIPKSVFIENIKINQIAIQKNRIRSMLSASWEFTKILKGYGDELDGLTVLMYAVNPVLLVPILFLKKKYSIHISTICSEVPKMRRFGDEILAKLKKSILSFYNERFDSYIFFAEAMRDLVKCQNKPYMILEGIAPEKFSKPKRYKENIILYAGGLAEDNNIPLLIKACSLIDSIKELWICGLGSDAYAVQKAASFDPRIKYFGYLPNEKIRQLESEAKLLVNLRSPNALLSRYSFPSKILEYISSGSMVLTTKLDGIPDEYYKYIEVLPSLDINVVSSVIDNLLSLDDETYFSKCSIAQEFVNKQKDLNTQSKRIREFIERRI